MLIKYIIVAAITIILHVSANAASVTLLKQEIPNQIGKEAIELIGYDYAKPDETFNYKAWETARGWIETVLSKEFWPLSSVDFKVHLGQSKTYDAIRVSYLTDGYQIQILQSSIAMIILIKQDGLSQLEERTAEKKINEIAHKMFKDIESVKLNFEKKSERVLFGGQNISKDKLYNQNWSDTIRWWADDSQLGFYLVKTKPRSPRLIVVGAEHDKRWFDSYNDIPYRIQK